VIILTPAGLVAITALPDQPEGGWCVIRANRPLDLQSILPGAPVTDMGPTDDGWRYAVIAPRRMVAQGLARCVESAAYPDMASAVPAQDQQLAELAQGILTIAAEMPWQAPAPNQPPNPFQIGSSSGDGPPQPTATSTSQGSPDDPATPEHLSHPLPVTFDQPAASPDPDQLTTYDGPLPVTITEDPFDALLPSEPTVCSTQNQSPGCSIPAADH
jgi:hypothetical protein